MKIIKMTDSLFIQRRRVMDMLYEAREVLSMELPRIKIRIVDFEEEKNTLGLCYIDQNYITISKSIDSWDEDYLRHIVWHELAHAYFNAKHDEKCPLMHPIANLGQKKALLTKALKKIAKAHSRPKSESLICL
jgi:hypothetical protein